MREGYRIERRLVIEELEQRVAPALVYQTLPWSGEDFSSWPGQEDGWTYYSSGGQGRIQIVSGALRMDSSGGSVLNEAVLHMDLSGAANVRLQFDHRDSKDEADVLPDWGVDWSGEHQNGDGVAISDDNGATWSTILSMGRDANWTTYTVDLDQAIERAGMSYSATFLIKFQQYDNCPWGVDGREYDNISLQAITPQPVNYNQDFSSGKPGEADGWEYYASVGTGRTWVVGGALRMDSSGGYALNEAILHLNLSGQSDVKLQFDHRDAYDEPDAMPGGTWSGHPNADGVAISDDGVNWYTVALLGRELNWATHVIDLSAAIAAAGMTSSADFQIKFQQYDNRWWGLDGREFDNIWVVAAGDPGNFVLNADSDGETYLYNYNSRICQITAADADEDAVVTGTWNAGSGTYDIVATNPLDTFESVNADYTDFTAESVGAINIGSSIEGTLTLDSFGAGDSITISGNLNNLSLTSGDFGGDLNLGGNLVGDIEVPGMISGNISSIGGNLGVWNGFGAKTDYSMGTKPMSVALGDLNGDGILDLAVANEDDDNVSIRLGQGDGTFGSEATYGAGGAPLYVAIGDLDNDSDLDLVVANSETMNVSVLLGNGDGTFAAAVNYGTSIGTGYVGIGDFNNDSIPDLAATNIHGGDVSILLGNGDGTFGTQTLISGLAGPVSIAMGDLDEDGNLDFGVITMFDNTLSIFLGNGDGTFAAGSTYATGTEPRSVTIGDLNGDSHLDLAVANSVLTASSVSVFLGNGDGTFRSGVAYGVGAVPTDVTAADLNGDGNLDLVTANAADDNISVLLGRGNGKFMTQTTYDVGDEPRGVAIGDLNGDGNPDAATANANGNSVSVLLAQVSGGIHAGDDLTGTISAPNGVILGGVIRIDGIIDASNGGEITRRVLGVETNFGYEENGVQKRFYLTGVEGAGQQGTLTIGGGAGQEGGSSSAGARADLTLNVDADTLTTYNINFNDLNVQNIREINIHSDVEGTLTMSSLGLTDSITISGSLNNFTISSGDMSGVLDVAGDVTGLIDIAGDLTGNGKLLAALFGDVEIMRDFLGQIGDSGTANGSGTLQIHSSGHSINGWVIKDGSLVNVTGEDLSFDGAFAVIDDLDTP